MKAKQYIRFYERVRASLFISFVIIWFFLAFGLMLLSLKDLLLSNNSFQQGFYLGIAGISGVISLLSLHLLGLFNSLLPSKQELKWDINKKYNLG